MEAFILVLYLAIPTSVPGAPVFQDMHREIVAGSIQTCATFGQKKIEELRPKLETIQGSQLKARCAPLPKLPTPEPTVTAGQ